MHKILVAVDGSEHSERAVRYLIGLIQDGGLLGGSVEVHLVNVQPLLPTRIAHDMRADEIDRYYGDKSAESSQKSWGASEAGRGCIYTSHLTRRCSKPNRGVLTLFRM